MSEGHFKASMVMATALFLALSGPLASSTLWSSGIYGLGYGSVSWPSMKAGTGEEIVQLGSYGIPTARASTVPVVQIGNYTVENVTTAETSGSVQLSGYYQNMGSFTNIYFRPILGGSFGSGGSSGCCGG
ncbi:MAG: hypothetical protein A4E50_00579 [Methanosaeta sp. PtaB.Bin087]|nr:MAG: hypothetical protein A4E50_00579 [Methanosaeta sp. PtaB.Bin087]OPY49116.1 MAG: hypothetical protein A4E51_02048 [Methanosaeta sp. PtaU1.Bin055]